MWAEYIWPKCYFRVTGLNYFLNFRVYGFIYSTFMYKITNIIFVPYWLHLFC